jgi:hypothetical protein
MWNYVSDRESGLIWIKEALIAGMAIFLNRRFLPATHRCDSERSRVDHHLHHCKANIRG